MRFVPVLLLAAALAASACGSDDDAPVPAQAAPAVAPPPSSPDARASCANGVRDGDETDVDCGGACGSTCALGQRCTLDECAGDALCAGLPALPDDTYICQEEVDDCSACAAGTSCRAFMEGEGASIYYCQPLAGAGD